MSVTEGFKRWVRFGPTKTPMPSCIERGVVVQKIGAKAICSPSCPANYPDLEPTGCFDVPKREKADPGSEKAGLKTWNGYPTCCHMGERAVVSSEVSELKAKLEN